MSKRVLLVGPEPIKLREAPDCQEALGPEWEVECASAAPQAFDFLYRTPIHALVADVRLPGTTGPQLLDTVMHRYPKVQRFLLADPTDKQTLLKCLGTAHPFLSRPCDAPMLRAALERAEQMDLLFSDDAARKLLAQMQRLPSPPAVYFEIVRELQSPHSSLETVGTLIGRDPAITAKLLQMVNSAALGLQRRVSSPADAVMFLGLETTKSLVLLAHTYSHFDKLPAGDFSVEALWRHSLNTGRIARLIARAEKAGVEISEQAFTAGLLHDLGKLLLVANRPEEFTRARALAREKHLRFWEAEQEVFGATHAEIGGWLLAVWGLPITLVEALALHHFPARLVSSGFSPLTAVHAANVFEHVLQQTPGELALPDMDYLAEIGLGDRIDTWQALAAPPKAAAA